VVSVFRLASCKCFNWDLEIRYFVYNRSIEHHDDQRRNPSHPNHLALSLDKVDRDVALVSLLVPLIPVDDTPEALQWITVFDSWMSCNPVAQCFVGRRQEHKPGTISCLAVRPGLEIRLRGPQFVAALKEQLLLRLSVLDKQVFPPTSRARLLVSKHGIEMELPWRYQFRIAHD
jgi:hypothetical protein